MTIVIRRAGADDRQRLAAFAARTFHDTYIEIDDPDDIAEHIGRHFTVEQIAAHIADPRSTMLLALAGERLAGYAHVRQSDPPPCVAGPAPIELARFYLARDAIGQGNGTLLLRAVHAEARARGARTIWLGVYDKNVRAIRFYTQAGFARVGEHRILFGGKPYFDPVMSAPVPE